MTAFNHMVSKPSLPHGADPGSAQGQPKTRLKTRLAKTQAGLSLVLILALLFSLLLVAAVPAKAESEGLGTYTMYGTMIKGEYTPLENLDSIFFLRFNGGFQGLLESFYFEEGGRIYYHGQDAFDYDVTQAGDVILTHIVNHPDAIFNWDGEIGVLQFKDYLGELVPDEYYLFMEADLPLRPDGQEITDPNQGAEVRPDFPAPPAKSDQETRPKFPGPSKPSPAETQPKPEDLDLPEELPDQTDQAPDHQTEEASKPADTQQAVPAAQDPATANLQLADLAGTWVRSPEDTEKLIRQAGFNPEDLAFDLVYEISPEGKVSAYTANLQLPANPDPHQAAALQDLIKASSDQVFQGELAAAEGGAFSFTKDQGQQTPVELSLENGQILQIRQSGLTESFVKQAEGQELQRSQQGTEVPTVAASTEEPAASSPEATEAPDQDQPQPGQAEPADEKDFSFDPETSAITEYLGEAEDLVIPDSLGGKPVLVIGRDAFSYKSLQSVVLPSGLKAIEAGAFSSNPLTSIDLPAGLEYIDSFAFNNTDLEQVVLPEGLEWLGRGVFQNTQLTEIRIPATVRSIGSEAFQGCQLTKLDFSPDSQLKIIGAVAFEENALTSLTLPDRLELIENGAFQNNQLKELNFGSNYPYTLLDIQTWAFGDNQIEKLVLPPSVLTIGASAFKDNQISSLVLPPYLEKMEEDAFKENSLKEVTLPALIAERRDQEVRDILIDCFDNEVQGDQAPLDKTFFLNLYGPLLDAGRDHQGHLPPDLPANNEREFAFDRATGTITQYEGDSLDVVIPDTIEGQPVLVLGAGSFSYKNLTSVVIPASVQRIDNDALRNNLLSHIDLPAGLLELGSYALAYNQLESLDLPQGLLRVGRGAFEENQLLALDIPASVQWLEEEAFANNRLRGLSFARPDLVDSVLFCKSGGPSQLRLIGQSCFAHNQLLGLYLPATLENVNYGAFSDNVLGFVDFASNYPYSMTTLDKQVFANNFLQDLYLPASIYALGDGAFRHNQLQSLTLPPVLQQLGDEAFVENKLSQVTLPSFIYKSKAKTSRDLLMASFDPEVQGDQPAPTPEMALSLAQAQVGAGRDHQGVLIHRTEPNPEREFEFDVATGTITKYVGEDKEVIIPDTIEGQPVLALGESALSYLNLTYLVIPDSVQRIEDSALRNNQLTSLTLPAGLQELGPNALCNNLLTSIDLPSGLTTITSSSLANNCLLSVEIPAGVQSIEDFAFNFNRLRSLTFQEGSCLTSIGNAAFQFNELLAVQLPGTVQEIGRSAFKDNLLAYINTGDLNVSLDEDALAENLMPAQP